ncbi:MarR family transcriptional regulator [Halosolutus gelatinilyticus]|uniref:MarR family transcriptional regulator n=1 Tax=Halosolutus gelatinilyticus TaxID=2931975 RepID=UPI001FF6A8C1|nr:MarR family transcriptional regulator [Halosolutus gelatinilyticus]
MTVRRHQQHRLSPEAIEPIPDDLESAQAKLVYLYLSATGGATADEMSETLSMKKIAILSLLETLASAGHVEERDDAYVVA